LLVSFAGAQLSELIGDLNSLNIFVEKAIELSQRYQLPTWNAHANVLAGWALAQSGQLEQGIMLSGEGIAKLRKIGTETSSLALFLLTSDNAREDGQ
jgi:predicted ATPase